MSEPQHPAVAFAGALKDLAEGRTDPTDWIAWWAVHAAEIEAACPRGWFLKLKPRQPEESGANAAALKSQDGACTILDALAVPFIRSDRYRLGWTEDFRLFIGREKERKALRVRELTPRFAALAEDFPKLARFLQRRAADVDQLEDPAAEAEIEALELALGVPLPDVYRRFLKCTRGVGLDGFSLGLQDTGLHPAMVPAEHGDAAALCIAEYCLKADGDQVLIERSAAPEPDPPVFYYAHMARTNTARKLAPRLSAWLESLPSSPVFRR